MAHVVDFTKMKKEYLTVKLDDEKKTVLLVGTPTKKILIEFIDINDRVSDDGDVDADTIDDLYNVCAKVMSFNKSGIHISADYLEDACGFDVADIMTFFNAYSDFMSSMTNAKN